MLFFNAFQTKIFNDIELVSPGHQNMKLQRLIGCLSHLWMLRVRPKVENNGKTMENISSDATRPDKSSRLSTHPFLRFLQNLDVHLCYSWMISMYYFYNLNKPVTVLSGIQNVFELSQTYLISVPYQKQASILRTQKSTVSQSYSVVNLPVSNQIS